VWWRRGTQQGECERVSGKAPTGAAVQGVQGRVAKWCERPSGDRAAAVGDDAALSVFTQLAGYGQRRRRRGPVMRRRGVSRARALRIT